MENLSKSLRKNISEIKEKKSNIIIEHSIVQSRLQFILEQKFKSKKDLAITFLSEMVNLEEQGFDIKQLNEQFDLFGFLGSLFGGSIKAVPEVIGEYLTDAIAKKFGIDQENYLYNVIRSIITSTNIADYGKLITDCRFLVNKLSDGLIEAVITQRQAKGTGPQSGGGEFIVNALRNAVLEKLIEDKTSLVQKLEDIVSSVICDAQSKWRQNISNLGKEMQSKVGLA